MKQQILIIISLFFFIGCSNKNNENPQLEKTKEQKPFVDALYQVPKDSLRFYTYKVQADQPQKTINLDNLPNRWIEVSKNAIGFFIYHKGKGYYSDITIENDTLTFGGFSESISWPIRQQTKISNREYLLELGSETINGAFATCRIEILGRDTLFAIQTTSIFDKKKGDKRLLHKYHGLYIPEFQKHLLPHIKEPNQKNPDSWIPHEEIDINKFKQKTTNQ